ncbi:DMT family transporter [Streptomyces sp. NPDC056405]|uniref:DMT family transporter n=1 Tax=Streptomyces sp. NPDC056405 TaxID=3345811 RepID=UPI0035D9A2F6
MTARGWFLFSLMGVVWGVPYLMIKVAVDEVSPSGVVFTRCALGALLLLPFALRQPGLVRNVRTHGKAMPAVAVIEIIGPWYTLTDAERHRSSSTAGLLIAGVPIVGVLLSRFFGAAESLGTRRVTGLALGLGGVGVSTVPHLTGGDALSLAEVSVTVIGYATAPLIAALAGLGVVCTAVAFVAFLELIKEAGPIRASVITYVNPAIAVAAGVLFLDEPLTATVLAAFALILTGSVLATTTTSKPRSRRVPWSTRQTSRAGGRVESLTGLPEERPGSTGQGDG